MSGVSRHLVVVALDALEAGDQELAVDVLLNAIDDGEDGGKGFAPTFMPRCVVCGVLAWPGEDWRHSWTAHYPVGGTVAA